MEKYLPNIQIADGDNTRAAMPVRIALVVPCYNEEDVLPETSRRLCLRKYGV